MKAANTILICLIVAFSAAAKTNDSIRECFQRIESTQKSVQLIQADNDKLHSEIVSLNDTILNQKAEITLLKEDLNKATNKIAALEDSLNIGISTTHLEIKTTKESVNHTIANKSQIGMWLFIIIAILLVVLAFVFGRIMSKRKSEVESLSLKADKLNEEIVNRLSNEMSEMQTLSKQISTLNNVSGGSSESEQKLITTLADRITFMEMTLYKMDSSVRGHKQLSKSIKQMKDNLLANGYELVDMLGKDYHDGMKVTANFIEDEDLPVGKQVITGVIKPQINYRGKMIQSAQITVSQNL